MNTPDDDNKQGMPGEHENGLPGQDAPSEGQDLTQVSDEDAGPAENRELQRIVQLLPPEDRAQLFAVMRRESMSHSGWLPTPQFMREYDEVLPGLAERIVAMPEREQSYRQKATIDIVKRDYRLRSNGQWMGMAALILLLAFCTLLAVLGGINAAASVAGVVIVGTVSVFVTGQVMGNKSSSKEVVEDDD